MLMEEALDRAKCKPSNINQTLLVGVALEFQLYRNNQKNYEKAPVKGVNVDEAVACGRLCMLVYKISLL